MTIDRVSLSGCGSESSGGSTEGFAIIGMACVFPRAPDLQAFWRNIMLKVDAIGEPPPAWEAERYLSSGRIKTSSGGYLKDLFRFNPREFGVMPLSVDGAEPDQFLALRVARDALADAGYLQEGYDHQCTGIVLGHSTYLHRGQGTMLQHHIVLDQTLDVLRLLCPELTGDKLDQIRKVLERTLPPATPDTVPGLVPNVMTGRIANRLNLQGPNYLVDGACASSLLAVSAAIDELRAGRSRMMLAGGVNASLPAEVLVIFSHLGALSGRGRVRPFEAGSDGTLLGEGLGVVVLKRLEDALEDQDRIYAVVRGVGQGSDGRGQGMLAPSVEGETLAMLRAYAATGVEPASVGLIEAHGTGIPLGDRTEISSLSNVFGARRGAQGSVALGSVKSMISHCIPAAGIAGLIKTAFALHHKVLPPTLCGEVNSDLGLSSTPFYVNTEAAPWISSLRAPRRAGVNAFGFGGINTHAIVEEAPPQARRPKDSTPWPAELCVFSADDGAGLIEKLEVFSEAVQRHPEWTLPELAAALLAGDAQSRHRLALVVDDRHALIEALARALKRLREPGAQRWAIRGGIAYSGEPIGGKMAFLFPGEGSQYPGMIADLALRFHEVREWLDFWCGVYDDLPGFRRTDLVFPPPSELTPERREELTRRLHDMDVGSEAAFIGGQAMVALLHRLGVQPDVMLGHSSGEFAALAASGAIVVDDKARLAASIRQLDRMYRGWLEAGSIPTGALLTVGALPLATVEQWIAEIDPEIVIAMDNCSNQLVLYGAPASISSLQARLTAIGGICMLLPFNRGYHTAAFAEVSAAFIGYYEEIGLRKPSVPLYSCATAERFPDDESAIRALAAAQWSQQVRFRETVQRMYADGVRTFIEVGPSGNLTGFVNDILAGSEHIALATNLRRRGGIEQILTVLAHLYVEARPLCLARLFESRAIDAIDLTQPASAVAGDLVLDNTMPRIRLGAAQCASLLALGAHQSPDADRAEVAAPSSGTEEVTVAPVMTPEPPCSEAVDPQQHLMAEYFDLMRGFLDQQRRALQSWEALGEADETRVEGEADSVPYMALLDSLLERDERHLVASCALSLGRQRFLADHILSGAVGEENSELKGLCCVPLMVSLEIMAEACALLAGSTNVQAIENVAALDWIALDDGDLTLEVHAQVMDADRGLYRGSLITPTGTAVTADFLFGEVQPRCAPLAPLRELRAPRWNDGELYPCGMFHGPTFQSIRHLDGWDDTGIDAQLGEPLLSGFLVENERPALVLNPVLLDAVGQLAAYWVAEEVGAAFHYFPASVERIELYAPCPDDVPGLRLRARQRLLGSSSSGASAPRVWNFEYLDGHGRVLARVANLRCAFFPVPRPFYEVRRNPLHGWLGQPTILPRCEGVLLWELPLLSDEFCSQSGGIFLRILAHIFLDGEERAEWGELGGNVRRRREWLLGRACIKEAVRYWIYQQTHHLLYPSEVVVRHDDRGAPFVDGPWRGYLVEAPEISLSHDRVSCLVAVGNPVCRVGVDREEIDRVQRPELLAAALTPNEQVLLQGLDGTLLQDRLLRIWCAKEAAAKLLGLGLQGAPEAFDVQFADSECRCACVRHADTPIHIDLVRENTTIIALASSPEREIQ